MRKEYFGYNEKAFSDEDWLEVALYQVRLQESWRTRHTPDPDTQEWSPKVNSKFVLTQPRCQIQQNWFRLRDILLPSFHEIPSDPRSAWFPKGGHFISAILPNLHIRQQHRWRDEDQEKYKIKNIVKTAYRKQFVEFNCHHRITVWYLPIDNHQLLDNHFDAWMCNIAFG